MAGVGVPQLAAIFSAADNTVGYNPYGSSIIAPGVIDASSLDFDQDEDGIADSIDNCPQAANAGGYEEFLPGVGGLLAEQRFQIPGDLLVSGRQLLCAGCG